MLALDWETLGVSYVDNAPSSFGITAYIKLFFLCENMSLSLVNKQVVETRLKQFEKERGF
jgi:hypothetical protein